MSLRVATMMLAVCLWTTASDGAAAPLGLLVHDGPATPEQISLYLPVTGPLEIAAAARVRYRPTAGTEWSAAHPLHRIRIADTAGTPPPDAFAGIITGLVPGTSYTVEVAVDVVGSPVVKMLTAVTRALPPAAGPATRVVAAGATAADIQAALDAATAGDVIQLSNDTYQVDNLRLRRSGTPEKPIVVRGESRGGVVLKNPSGDVLQVGAVADVIIENLTLEGSRSDSGTAASSRGIHFLNAPAPQQRVTIRNVTIEGVDVGIIAPRSAEAALVYDNTLIGNNTWDQASLESNLTWNDDGIRLPGQGNAVFNNTLSGFGDAVALKWRGQNVGLHFYRNEITMTGDDAFEADRGVRNITIHDNRVHNSMTLVSFDPIYGGPAFVFRNIAINVGRSPYKLTNRNSGFFLYNNTVVRTTGTRSGARWGWVQSDNGPLVGWGYRNNILIYRGEGNLLAMESRGQDPIDFTHNAWYPDGSVWWTKSGGSFKSLSAARSRLRTTTPVFSGSSKRHEACVITEPDPFVEKVELGKSYLTLTTRRDAPRLADGTAPRGAGVAIPGVTDGFSGKAPDMGALISGVPDPMWGDRSGRRRE